MTGRARGRSRGRARAGQQQEPAPRPGAPPAEEAPQAPPAARGRGRAPAAAAPAPTPVQQQRAPDVAQVTRKMAEVTTEEQAPRGFAQLETRPSNISVTRGDAGVPVQLRTNYFRLIQMPKFDGFYQYAVSFNPPIESRKLRFMLLKDHAEMLGSVRAFDGMILYLPMRLPETETRVVSVTKRDQTSVEIIIKFTNHIPFNSPTTLTLMSIIFRR